MRFRVMTDAFGLDQPRYMGGLHDGEPLWTLKQSAWCFDQDSAVLVSMRLDQVTLEPEQNATLDQVKPRLPIILFQPDHAEDDDA